MRIVLLHGLLRTRGSMRALVNPLTRDGHEVHAITYPSHRLPYRRILDYVARQLAVRGLLRSPEDIGFVGHSMGGIIWRDLPLVMPGFVAGKSVLLGSPLHGSVVARSLGKGPLARLFLGAAGHELSAERGDDLTFPGPFATVAGTKWSPFVPAAHLVRRVAPNEPSDSTVLVREARSTLESAHLQIDAAHTFLPAHPAAIAFTRSFLST